MVDYGFCLKCKKRKEMDNVVRKTLGGRIQIKGQCKVCGTNMSVFAKN